jgi:hypothetical protein
MEADMGLMDRVKAQATVLAQKTQETAREGMARLDQATAARHADTMLRNLGALFYAEQTGRGAPDAQDQIARLVSEISAHEAENGINLATQPAGWSAGAAGQPAPGSAPVPYGEPGQPGPAAQPPFGEAGQEAPGQPAPGWPGAAGQGAADQPAPGWPGAAEQPGQPGQAPYGAPGQAQAGPPTPGQGFGGSAPTGATYTQPEYTFPQPPSDEDPEPGR